jgi:Superinfection immunity protein
VTKTRPGPGVYLAVMMATRASAALAATDAGSAGYGIAVFLVVLAIYFFPWIVANHQRHHSQAALFCLNLFLGWTLVAWVLALVWALSRPAIFIVQGATGTAPPTVPAVAKQPGGANSIGKVVVGLVATVGILAIIGSLAWRDSNNGSAPTVEPKKVDFGTQRMGCALSDFSLEQTNWHRESAEFVRIVGELVSNCSEPAGVQLQVVFRDKDGKVVTTEEFWPASTRNIVPHSDYPFSMLTRVG